MNSESKELLKLLDQHTVQQNVKDILRLTFQAWTSETATNEIAAKADQIRQKLSYFLMYTLSLIG